MLDRLLNWRLWQPGEAEERRRAEELNREVRLLVIEASCIYFLAKEASEHVKRCGTTPTPNEGLTFRAGRLAMAANDLHARLAPDDQNRLIVKYIYELMLLV